MDSTLGDTRLSRRGALIGGAACTLAACGLAGCASYGPEAEPSGGAPTGGLTAPTAEIPVGGGKIFDQQKVVVTQPAAGQFKAFSAICTHQGCTVGTVATTIDCPCHGSKFSITDGSVVNGPATAPLPALTAKVQGSDVVVS
ncbi:Rieske (2Fe-2S) protein [Microlunatus ginsengisoli]|uniref:Cytochrome bc1 complex Rieske iron-sulfur subunit n=1 Tax=Microlunatus ginsengisoli TaxID=363863 RepID=A0ABP7AD43_9ACTN